MHSFLSFFHINSINDIGLQFDVSVKEPLLLAGFSFAILQESVNFLEFTERLHKSVMRLAKTFKKGPVTLPKKAALDALVFSKLVKMVFSETVRRLKESP